MTTPSAPTRVHAFTNDVLGEHDAVALAQLVRDGAVSALELAEAAIARARAIDPQLNAIAYESFDRPIFAPDRSGAFAGVPSFIKDNTDVVGIPTRHGSEAFVAHPAKATGAYAAQYMSTGVTVLGKTRLPEFGFSASCEFMRQEPVRNPWHTDHTIGGSSGGSAALVVSGVVPLAHGNDGGGSIRIPAACAGLVGLKPSRGRLADGAQAKQLPINVVAEGVLTRTVRDTAAFLAAAEDYRRNPKLQPIGQVHGPAQRRMRIGLVLDSPVATVEPETRAAVEQAARLLEKAGHVVEPISLPFTAQIGADFIQYYALLAELAYDTGKLTHGRTFDTRQLDNVTIGLRRHHRAHLRTTPGALLRLRRAAATYATMFARHELVLSPVLAHPAPELGYLSPMVDFDELLDRLTKFAAYTPLNNITGTPAISLPLGMSSHGIPIGVQLSAAYGDERTLLETAYALEAEQPFARIYAEQGQSL